MQDLYNLGIVRLRESSLIPTVGMEFYFSGSVTAAGNSLDRLSVHKDIVREQIEGFRQIVEA